MYKLYPIPAFNDNYIWAIIHLSNQTCAIVDPGDAEPVNHFLEQQQLSLAAVLITHHHWDHTGGLPTLAKSYQLPVYGPAHDGIPRLDYHLTEQDSVQLEALSLQFKVLDIPGHTKGHIAFYNDQWVFTGDTLFTGGCGRLFEGTAEQMYRSLEKLSQLPETTQLFCGHEYTQNNLRFAKAVEPDNTKLIQRINKTAQLRQQNLPTVPATLATELATNPFLRCTQPQVKAAAEQYASKPLADPVEVFAALREWKNRDY